MEKSKLILYSIIVQRKRRSTQKYTDSPPQDFETGGFFEGADGYFYKSYLPFLGDNTDLLHLFNELTKTEKPKTE